MAIDDVIPQPRRTPIRTHGWNRKIESSWGRIFGKKNNKCDKEVTAKEGGDSKE